MATKVTGVNGSVTIPSAAGGQTGLIYRWNARIEREVLDVTTFADAGSARVKVGGMMKLTGSCEAYFDDTTPVIADSAGVTIADAVVAAGFVLQGYTSRTYTFNAAMSGIRVVAEKVGQIAVTMSFESGWLTGTPDIAVA